MRSPALSAAVLLVAALGACGGGDEEDAGDAVAAFEAFRGALRDEDYGRAYDLLSRADTARVEEAAGRLRADVANREADAKARERVEAQAAAFGTTPEELATWSARELFVRGTAIRGNRQALGRWAEAELAEAPRITGDVAVIRARLPGRPDEVLHLVREDGRWRITLRPPPGVTR